MPIWIEKRRSAHRVELRAFRSGEHEIRGSEIVLKLRISSRSNHNRGNSRPTDQPREGDLCCRDPVCLGDTDKHLDYVIKRFLIAHRRFAPVRQLASALRRLMSAAVFAVPPARGLQIKMPTP